MAWQGRNGAMTGEGRLQHRLTNAKQVINRLAQTPPATTADCTHCVERIANPDKFDGSRDKLKAFKGQFLREPHALPQCAA